MSEAGLRVRSACILALSPLLPPRRAAKNHDGDRLMDQPARVCGVCAREFASYTCPRCAVQYCSLGCYRAHGAACTDAFQREQADSSLPAAPPGPAEREAMAGILRRLRGQSLDGEEDSEGDGPNASPAPAEEERVHALQRLASAGELDAVELSADEQRDFERQVANGSLAKFLERTEAWWSVLAPSSVERLADGTFRSRDLRAPRMLAPLAPIGRLTSRTPAPAVRFVVLELLASYAYVHRLYDCEPSADTDDAARCLLQLSAALSGDERGAFASALAALRSVAERSMSPLTKTSREFTAASFADVRALLGAPHGAALALSDLHGLLSAQRGPKAGGGAAQQLACRKVVFMAAWWCGQTDEALSATCAELATAVGTHLAEMAALAGEEAALRRRDGPRLAVASDRSRGGTAGFSSRRPGAGAQR